MTHTHKGRLEIICGSMFSGKTEELIRRLRRASYARASVQAFKHAFDTRVGTAHIHAHGGDRLPAAAVSKSHEILELCQAEAHIIGIDEIQFFDAGIVNAVMQLVESGKRVVASGLDLDFRGVPFGPMPELLALADEVVKLRAVCAHCSADAHFTQRLVNGKPARANDPVVLIGAEECYQARCRNCYVLAPANY